MYFFRRYLFIAVVALGASLGFPYPARADQEGRLPIGRIQLDSPGMDDSGPVHIEVFQDSKGISELEISAFGKLHKVMNSQLAVVSGHEFNGVGVSYSKGYTNLGGRNVNVLLYEGFSSGTQLIAIVSIQEHGEVRIRIGAPDVQ
jgi:hypothetical protein